MTTQAPPSSQPSSQHLAAAQELLDELHTVIHGEADSDHQTKALTATAQAILVLAEQVAAIRVLMVGNVMAHRENGQSTQQDEQASAPHHEKTPKKRGWW